MGERTLACGAFVPRNTFVSFLYPFQTFDRIVSVSFTCASLDQDGDLRNLLNLVHKSRWLVSCTDIRATQPVKLTMKKELLFAVILAAFCPLAAKAGLIYDFSGTCSHVCTGSATGVLSVDGYTPPNQAVTNGITATLVITVNSVAYTLSSLYSGFTFQLPLNAGKGKMAFSDPGLIFIAGSDWKFSTPGGQACPGYCGGTDYQFTRRPDVPDPVVPVPEPGTLSLLGAGLVGLGFLRRHRAA